MSVGLCAENDSSKRFDMLELTSKDDVLEDEDTCSAEIFSDLFPVPFHLVSQTSLSLSKEYVLHMAGTREPDPQLCVGTSSSVVSIYKMSHLQKVTSLREAETVIGVRCSPLNTNILYVGSSHGINVWDLRKSDNSVLQLKDDSSKDSKWKKTLLSFDIASNDRFLCAGTELADEDAFLLFWDVRSAKQLGGYWESHSDDVTQIRFHSKIPDRLATGSTDGFVNIFDISQSSEDDALLSTHNTESSVSTLRWSTRNNRNTYVTCITHTEDIQMWDADDDPIKVTTFSRKNVTDAMKRKVVDHCYIVDSFEIADDRVALLAGSNDDRRGCLRLLDASTTDLQPLSNIGDEKTSRQVTRCCWYNTNSQLLVTGGESGLLYLWKQGTEPEDNIVTSKGAKMESKLKEKKNVKPYSK